jgi:GNAT superfamily N-acetyltransferase
VKIISDKHGEKYRVVIHDDETGPVFKMMTADSKIQETEVGYANCLYEGDGILMLADIHIKEDAVLVYRRTGLFRMFQEVKREQKDFQRCGLGTELLKCVFAFAEEMGIERIVGKIKKVDYPQNPYLPKWYAEMGFTVTMETEPSAVVAKISKEL